MIPNGAFLSPYDCALYESARNGYLRYFDIEDCAKCIKIGQVKKEKKYSILNMDCFFVVVINLITNHRKHARQRLHHTIDHQNYTLTNLRTVNYVCATVKPVLSGTPPPPPAPQLSGHPLLRGTFYICLRNKPLWSLDTSINWTRTLK